MAIIDQVPDWLRDSQGESWLRLLNDWGYSHPSELIVGNFLLSLFLIGLVVIVRVHKMANHQARHHWNDDNLFEKKLGVSAADLAEVGLPLAHSEASVMASSVDAQLKVAPPIPTQSPPSPPESVDDLSLEECVLVARFCAWRGDSEGVRLAIRRIMVEGNAAQQKQALLILERSNLPAL